MSYRYSTRSFLSVKPQQHFLWLVLLLYSSSKTVLFHCFSAPTVKQVETTTVAQSQFNWVLSVVMVIVAEIQLNLGKTPLSFQ